MNYHSKPTLITVQDALKMAELRHAHIVTGQDALNRPISWVHVVGVPDAPDWLNGGELVLTTPINLPPDAAGQGAYIQAMANKGIAALMLAVGRHMDHAPEAMRAAAEACALPLIEIPFQTRFVDIARALNQRISNEHMGLLERALTIHRVLTQLVLDGGDLHQLAVTLADLIGQSISIENERFEALASHNIAPVDEARRYTLTKGQTNPRLIETLENNDILGEIRRTLRPVHIPQMPEVGLEMERILAPIVVHGSIYGYLWIIADDRPLSQLDAMAIESGATVAALMRLHQELIATAEANLKGGLLAQLIEGDAARLDALTDQALRYRVDLNQPFVMLMIERTDANVIETGDSSTGRLLLQRRINRLSADGQAVVGQFAGEIVVLASADALPTLIAAIHQHIAGIRIGVSGAQRSAATVAIAYTQCRDALHIARRLAMTDPTIPFEQLGYLHTLYQAGKDSLTQNAYAPALRRLGAEQQADLFHTLEVYLDAGGNGVQTADQLFIHRSTLNYRLQRISEVCAADLSNPVTRMNLQVALKLLRLFDE